MSRKIFTILCILGIVGVANAQPVALNPCQTVFDERMEQQLDDFVQGYYYDNTIPEETVMKYLPITVHLIANSDGLFRMSTSYALDLICTLNEQYANTNADIFFYLDDFTYNINNTTWNGANGNLPFVGSLYKNHLTINAFIMNKGNTANVCGVYYGGDDVVFMSRGCLDPSSSTWAHEFGHLLSLPHTFFGWEGNNYNCGTPAGAWAEKLDGSNCTTAADRFCDTGPDYLSNRWPCGPDSISTCLHEDSNGDTFYPKGQYFMSYSFDNCTGEFSGDQIAAMHHNINTVRNPIASTSPTWVTLGETDTTTLISPIGGDTTDYTNVINFNWEEVPGATHYVVEFTYLPTFSFVLREEVVTTNHLVINDPLVANKLHYWRVRPYNAGSFCTPFSSTYSFTTGALTNVDAISAFEEVSVFPNPSTAGRTSILSVQSTEEINSELMIVDMKGSTVYAENNVRINQGENNIELSIEDLVPGVYFVSLQNGSGIVTKKLLVTP